MVMDRPTFDGQRQRDALKALQESSGRDATAVARDVGLSYPQYNRYLWGRVPLRTDQIATFAAAYGATSAELSRALGLLDDEGIDTRTLREILHGEIPEGDIERFAVEHEGKPLADQQAAAFGILRLAALQRERTRSAS
jgi:hypothetical protein